MGDLLLSSNMKNFCGTRHGMDTGAHCSEPETYWLRNFKPTPPTWCTEGRGQAWSRPTLVQKPISKATLPRLKQLRHWTAYGWTSALKRSQASLSRQRTLFVTISSLSRVSATAVKNSTVDLAFWVVVVLGYPVELLFSIILVGLVGWETN